MTSLFDKPVGMINNASRKPLNKPKTLKYAVNGNSQNNDVMIVMTLYPHRQRVRVQCSAGGGDCGVPWPYIIINRPLYADVISFFGFFVIRKYEQICKIDENS